MSRKEVTPILRSWKALSVGVMRLSEAQLATLLHTERNGARRPTFMQRIYGRFAKVRELRERRELLK